MYCPECGAGNAEGARFCRKCGAGMGQPVQAPAALPSPARDVDGRRQPAGDGKAGGWLRSPAGIALLAIIAVAVLGGAAVGIIFAVRGCGPSAVEELAKIWNEYQDIAGRAEAAQKGITLVPAELMRAQEGLDTARKKAADLEKALADTGVSEQHDGYVTLRETLELYDRYAEALVAVYATLTEAIGNGTLSAVRAEVESRVGEIKEMISSLGDLTDEFLEGNDAVKAKPSFSSEVATDTVDDLVAELAKAATAETEAKAREEEERPYVEAAGIYLASDGSSITLHSDRTVDAIHADRGTSSGTYAISGTTITFVSEGITDVGTLENGVITAPDGRRWVKQR